MDVEKGTLRKFREERNHKRGQRVRERSCVRELPKAKYGASHSAHESSIEKQELERPSGCSADWRV